MPISQVSKYWARLSDDEQSAWAAELGIPRHQLARLVELRSRPRHAMLWRIIDTSRGNIKFVDAAWHWWGRDAKTQRERAHTQEKIANAKQNRAPTVSPGR